MPIATAEGGLGHDSPPLPLHHDCVHLFHLTLDFLSHTHALPPDALLLALKETACSAVAEATAASTPTSAPDLIIAPLPAPATQEAEHPAVAEAGATSSAAAGGDADADLKGNRSGPSPEPSPLQAPSEALIAGRDDIPGDDDVVVVPISKDHGAAVVAVMGEVRYRAAKRMAEIATAQIQLLLNFGTSISSPARCVRRGGLGCNKC